MLHTPKTIFAALALLLAAGVSANITPNTYAETSVSADGSATVTLHVLGADEPSRSNPDSAEPDADPGVYTDDETVDNSDDEADDLNLEEDTEEELNSGEDDGTNINEEDSAEADEAATAAATAAAGDSGNPTTPDTGASTAPEEGTGFNPLVIIIPAALIALIAFVVKVIKDERSGQLRRQLHRHSQLLSNSRFGLSFKHEHSHKYSIGKIASCATVSALAVFAVTFFLTNNTPEESEAASDAYPYEITLTNDNNYDIYVKPGEFARAAFKINTATNNPTGYTLTMAADQQSLTSSEGSLASITTDTESANFGDNTWGISTDGQTYSRVPNTHSAGITLHSTKKDTAAGNNAVIYFGVKTASDLPAGTYTAHINFSSRTNLVKKTLKFLNGNVATVTRVSDGSTLKNNSEIYVGEKLKVNSVADAADITQTAAVNGETVSNGSTITVSKNVKVSTSDDSMHFLKNALSSSGGGSNGDAILIKSQGKYWLVDTGHNGADDQWLNGAKVAAYLKALGVTRLDYVLLTHAHGDHTGGLKKLISKRYVRPSTTVYLRGCEATQNVVDDYPDYGQASSKLKNACETKVNLLKNLTVTLSDGTTTTESANVIDFYNHESERADIYKNGVDFGNFHVDFYNIEKGSNGHIDYDRYRENLNSIGTKWTHKPSGKTVFLSGDFEYGNEVAYGSKIGKVDILKAGHHGAKTSNSYEFYKKLNPSTVLVTGVNRTTKDGTPRTQAAAWAYVEQKGGSVYFTGDSTGSAVAINFTKSGYTVKKGTKHSIIADANTGNSKNSANYHRQVGVRTWNWNGGVLAWVRPYATTGEGGDAVYFKMQSASDDKHYYAGLYVYVFQSKTNDNIIRQADLCTDNYKYTFKASYGDGVSKGRTKVKSC